MRNCEAKGCKNEKVKGRWCYDHWKESLKGYEDATPEIREELYMSYVTGDSNVQVLAARYGLSSTCLSVILNELFENPPGTAIPERTMIGRQEFATMWQTIGPWGIVHRFPELTLDEIKKAKKDLLDNGYDIKRSPLVVSSSMWETGMKIPIGEVLYVKRLWAKGGSKSSIYKHVRRNWYTLDRMVNMDVPPVLRYVEEFVKGERDVRPHKPYDRGTKIGKKTGSKKGVFGPKKTVFGPA